MNKTKDEWVTTTDGDGDLPTWTDAQHMPIPDPFTPTGICENCGERPATCKWVGEGGGMAAVHGMASNWCELCALKAQLEYARAMVSRIPRLERDLAAAKWKVAAELMSKPNTEEG